ncbi:hypothetical protein [Angustibacter aerolatus]
MSEQQARAARRRSRAITAGVLAGGITLAGGAAAFAAGGHDGSDADGRTPRTTHSAAQPAAQPAESTRRTREAGQTRRTEAKKAATSATSTSGRRGTTPSKTPLPADDVDQAAYDAYWGAGYDENDASLLAELWHQDYFQAKQTAGAKLAAGKKLPIEPGEGAKLLPKTDRQIDAFFRAGYDYDDAVKLRKLWHTEDVYGAKLKAGKKLLAHQTLPVKP